MVRLVSSKSKNNGYFEQFEKECGKITPEFACLSNISFNSKK